jgi:hypothetical protein
VVEHKIENNLNPDFMQGLDQIAKFIHPAQGMLMSTALPLTEAKARKTLYQAEAHSSFITLQLSLIFAYFYCNLAILQKFAEVDSSQGQLFLSGG